MNSTVRETVPSPALATPRRRARIADPASLLIFVAMTIVPLFATNFIVFQMATLLDYAMAIVALNFLTGGSGQISLGQSAFFAFGAYTAAILIEQGGVNYALTLPIAGAACFAFGFLFGLPALRLSGVYLALATFALAIAVPQILKLTALEAWTGGVQGLTITKPQPPAFLPISQDTWLYYLTLLVALVIYVATKNLLNSRSGRAMMAIRDNQIAASAVGVNIALYKTLAFGISASFTGIAGALSAMTVQYVAPDSYSVQFAIAILVGMVVGGVGWLPGSFIGAAFLVFVPNIAENVSKGLSGAVFGLILVAVIFLRSRLSRHIVEFIGKYRAERGATAR